MFIAERIPGFGGRYVDEEGTTYVYLTDLSLASAAESLGDRVVVLQGEFDFRDLYAWKKYLRERLPWESVAMLDIDERINRLVVGVPEEEVDRFESDLPRLLEGQVPERAVAVEAFEPYEPYENTSDAIRPVPGGVEVGMSLGACTLGFNAFRLGKQGFVTSSHCTEVRAKLEGTVFDQDFMGERIGVETLDPPAFTNSGCPSGKKCRRSDSAFVTYDSPSLSAGAKLAKPLICGPVPGSLFIDPAQPRLNVTAMSLASPLSGAVVTKIGAATGCTIGSLSRTCADLKSFRTPDFFLLCQNVVLGAPGFSNLGDSGSPVFLRNGGNATALGILFGGAGNYYGYSPWLNIMIDLPTVWPAL